MLLTAASVPGYVVLDPAVPAEPGAVVTARRRADGRVVLLRVLPVGSDGVVAAMGRAAGLVPVRSTGLLRVLDVLPLPGPGARPAAVLVASEKPEGPSFDHLVSSAGCLPPDQTVWVLEQVAAILVGMHAEGVSHGAVGPATVTREPDGSVLLSDLGAALTGRFSTGLGTAGMGQTGTGQAPEALDGTGTGPEADVHGWAVLAWWCLTGSRPPHPGRPGAFATVAPHVPAELVDLIEKCLLPEPADRPLATEVHAAVRSLPADIGHRSPRTVHPRAAHPRAVRGERAAGAPAVRKRWLAIGVVAAVLAVGGWAGSLLMGHAPTSSGEQAAVSAVQELLDARAEAWHSGDPAALDAVHVSGGASWVADADDLREAAGLGARYEGVQFVVRSATVQPGSSEPDRMVIRAEVERSAYLVRLPSGDEHQRAAHTTEVTVELVREDGQWRILAWS